jgi:hypothetical protein
MGHFKKNIDVYLLNYLLLIIYFIFFSSLHIDINGGILFTTVDSITYLETSSEFYKLSETGYSFIRPFLYPFLILLVYKPLGATALWLMQVLFWMLSINLVFFSIKHLTGKRILGYASGLIMALNFSYFGLTMQCLTEVTAILLISVLIYFVAYNFKNAHDLKFFHGSLFILILLAVLKPVFLLPALLMLFILFPVFYLKKYYRAPKHLITLLLVFSPLLFQITLMKIKYDSFSISSISNETFRNYILAQGVIEIENKSLEDARKKTTSFSPSEAREYLLGNKLVYFDIYLRNLKMNMNAFPSFLLGQRQFQFPAYVSYMGILNSIYYYLHLIFILPLIALLLLFYKRKEVYRFILFIFCSILAYYIFLTSPVSFGEGDRLIITALPVWVFLYTLIFNHFVDYFKLKGQERAKI